MIVIAVDPGKMCGVAVWQEDRLAQAQQLKQYAFHEWAEVVIPTFAAHDLRVVCEDFRLSPASLKTGSDWQWPCASMGVLRYWCEKAGVPFSKQSPAEAKTFATDAKLKALGWYTPTPGGHTNDALRHLLVYLVNQRQVQPPVV